MSAKTSIEWTDSTWSPVLGCSPASKGCAGCYAIRTVWRMAHNPNRKIAEAREGLVEKTSAGVLRWTGRVRCLPEQLAVPLHWRAPRRIFVANQSDLFHPEVSDEFVNRVCSVIARCPQHTFQVLTKRAERMRTFFAGWMRPPLKNLWVGVSVENQAAADERIPELLATPAAVRFLSCEPLLGPIDLEQYIWGTVSDTAGYFDRNGRQRSGGAGGQMLCSRPRNALHWMICGGESGPGARPCSVDWIRSILRQCKAAEVPAFCKQLGAHALAGYYDRTWRDLYETGGFEWPDPEGWDERDGQPHPDAQVRLFFDDRAGRDPAEWAEDLRVREFPRRTP